MEIIAASIAFVNTLRYGKNMDKKLNRHRWLTAGLQTLANEGPEGLKIMPIAAQLGATKGSFYWHFKNLEDYQSALLEEWERCYTQEAIHFLENSPDDPKSKLRTWITGAAYADTKLDRAIRSWSLHHPAAREARIRVDADRISYLVKLLHGVGWPKEDAQSLGEWTYCAWVGYATLDAAASEKQLKLVLSLLTPR
jgi:AcrR family transcriptional regulator